MSEIEIIKVQIKDLYNAFAEIVRAMNNINDFDALDETYKSLDLALYDIEDQKIKLEIKLEDLIEEAMYKENEEQWKREQKDQDYQYMKGAI